MTILAAAYHTDGLLEIKAAVTRIRRKKQKEFSMRQKDIEALTSTARVI
jgi:hypothetical protein